jgi:hypothetical protein
LIATKLKRTLIRNFYFAEALAFYELYYAPLVSIYPPARKAVYFAYYNFCRVDSSLRVSPALEAGITDHIWTLRELLSVE